MATPILSCSYKHAVTRNYADDRRMYYYRVTDDAHLEHRIGSGEWWIAFSTQSAEKVNKAWLKTASNERDAIGPITRVAADSNRVFIMTADNRLYWRCLHEDSASWVLLVFVVAQVIGYGDNALSEASEQAWNLINSIPNFREWLGADSSDAAPGELADKLIWSLFPDEMKHVEGLDCHRTDLADWATKYREWVLNTHKPENGWNPLIERTWMLGNGTEVTHEDFLSGTDATDSHQIVDIAVGNWHNTVITYYALTKSSNGRMRIFYLDEEALMHSWKEVPKQETLRFYDESMICASHSVIAVTGRCPDSVDRKKIHWMRFDAHTNEHIPFWPLNWTETWVDVKIGPATADDFPDGFDVSQPHDMGPWSEFLELFPPFGVFDERNYPDWHEVDVPCKYLDELRIDVGFGTLPWPTPKPHVIGPFFSPTGLIQIATSLAWKVYILMCVVSSVIDTIRNQDRSDVGFLGENPITPNTEYPVCCIVKGEQGFKGFAIARSEDTANWEDLDVESATADTWLCRTVTRWVDELRRITKSERECIEEADSRRWACTAWECPWPIPEFLCDAGKLVCVAGVWVLEIICKWVATIVEWTERILISVTDCTNPCRDARFRSDGPTPGGKSAEGVTTWKKATTFMQALVMVKKVPANIARERGEICRACAFIRCGRCALCGCSVRTRLKVVNLVTYEENLPKWGCKHPWRSKGQGWPTNNAGA